ISATGSLACAQRAFDLTRDFVIERKAFGQRIADFQNTRFKLAELRTELDMCQVFIDKCVEVHNQGKLSSEMASKAKLYATELEGRVTDEGVQLHGGAGYMDEYEISRLYTNARISRIYAGSSEIMKEIVARSVLDD
ncbi:MAG TPA: acyl-CoA dehydrogenase, partial [Porticoccaceae bacterium]|nr:acyl-CoA dehydrogenase [Porticoccaceae bacterium]